MHTKQKSPDLNFIYTTRKSTAKKCSCTNVTEWNGKLAALFAHKTIKLDSRWRTFLAFLTRIWLSLHVRYTKRTLSLLYRALKIHVLRLKIIPPTPLLIRTIFKVLSSNSSFTLPSRITVMNSLHYVTLVCVEEGVLLLFSLSAQNDKTLNCVWFRFLGQGFKRARIVQIVIDYGFGRQKSLNILQLSPLKDPHKLNLLVFKNWQQLVLTGP